MVTGWVSISVIRIMDNTVLSAVLHITFSQNYWIFFFSCYKKEVNLTKHTQKWLRIQYICFFHWHSCLDFNNNKSLYKYVTIVDFFVLSNEFYNGFNVTELHSQGYVFLSSISWYLPKRLWLRKFLSRFSIVCSFWWIQMLC